MRHGLKWLIHLRAQRPRVKDEHPAYAPDGARPGLKAFALIILGIRIAKTIELYKVDSFFHLT